MDFSTGIFHVFGKFWYLLLIPVLLALLKIPQLKSCIREPVVSFFTCMMLNKNRYHRIANVILPLEKGTTLIDHIIVSIYGVFVIETVNMTNRIYHDPDPKTRIQKRDKYTNNFQDPVSGVYRHVNTLQCMLGLKDNQIYPVVALTGGNISGIDIPENVTRGLGFIRFIKSKKQQVLTEYEVMEIKLKIVDARLDQSSINTQRHRCH